MPHTKTDNPNAVRGPRYAATPTAALPMNVVIGLREASRGRRMVRDAGHALNGISADARLNAMPLYRQLQAQSNTLTRAALAEFERHTACERILDALDAATPPRAEAGSVGCANMNQAAGAPLPRLEARAATALSPVHARCAEPACAPSHSEGHA